jgi:hypothetical protein
MNDNNYIHEYIYDKRRQLKGVWAAVPAKTNSDEVSIGFSLCNTKLGDRFDRKRGLDIAIGRSYLQSSVPIPQSLNEGYNFFRNRCTRYFKDKKVLF